VICQAPQILRGFFSVLAPFTEILKPSNHAFCFSLQRAFFFSSVFFIAKAKYHTGLPACLAGCLPIARK
jgi:hypothetical protein